MLMLLAVARVPAVPPVVVVVAELLLELLPPPQAATAAATPTTAAPDAAKLVRRRTTAPFVPSVVPVLDQPGQATPASSTEGVGLEEPVRSLPT
jgi:hypothetical protein